jgi:hypothetical protein
MLVIYSFPFLLSFLLFSYPSTISRSLSEIITFFPCIFLPFFPFSLASLLPFLPFKGVFVVVVMDCLFYWIHRCLHEIPVLRRKFAALSLSLSLSPPPPPNHRRRHTRLQPPPQLLTPAVVVVVVVVEWWQ